MAMHDCYKIPESVLVVIFTAAGDVLLLNRADNPGFWQSVTGAKNCATESWQATAAREVEEETGLDCQADGHFLADWGLENVYEIYPAWRHRYAPGVLLNTERVFGLCVPHRVPVQLSPREHVEFRWLPWREAAWRCSSASNAEAVLQLPARYGLA